MSDTADDLLIELAEASGRDEGSQGPLIFVADEVLERVQLHACQDPHRELAGILVGTAASSPEGTLVAIEAAIPASRTDAGPASVTFTHDTWEEINRVKDRDYPDKRIVGWYHTHPGFGLFLSEHDLFIHRNFFNLPWQVALVLDPRSHRAGFFVWGGEKIEGPRAFASYGVRSSSAGPVEALSLPSSSGNAAQAAPRLGLAAALAMSLFTLLALVFVLKTLLETPARVSRTVATALMPLQAELHGLRGQMVELSRQRAEARPAVPPAPNSHSPRTYTVRRGDSLWRIARRMYGNGAKWGAIAVANGVEVDDLEPGMVLVIPQPPAKAGHR